MFAHPKFSYIYQIKIQLKLMAMYILGILGPQEIVLFCILLFLLPISALISILSNSFPGNDKLVWVIVVLFLPVFGSILYFLIGRNKRIKKNNS
ncbi:MAG: PLDc N-terminal domain-containing protein [Mangrovibacterium sp.]